METVFQAVKGGLPFRPAKSEVLTLGVPDDHWNVVLTGMGRWKASCAEHRWT